eukprot:9452627-Alexandrium_andersonii.AAC.1
MDARWPPVRGGSAARGAASERPARVRAVGRPRDLVSGLQARRSSGGVGRVTRPCREPEFSGVGGTGKLP